MADGVAGAVEEVEGAVAKVVVCWEAADLEGRCRFAGGAGGGGEVNLDEVAARVVGFENRRVLARRVAWGESLLEAGADD